MRGRRKARPRWLTYSAIAQIFDHAQRPFDIRNLVFEPAPPLCQVAVHIAVLPTETNASLKGEGVVSKGRKRKQRVRQVGCVY